MKQTEGPPALILLLEGAPPGKAGPGGGVELRAPSHLSPCVSSLWLSCAESFITSW